MAFESIMRNAVRIVPHSIRSFIKDVPLLAATQRYLVNACLSGRSFIHTIDAGPAKGISYKLTLPEDKGIWTGNYEPEFANHLASEVRPGMIAYDIGAWHGYFTGVMLSNGASKVVLFEPLPENLQRLEQLIELNPKHDVVVEPIALADRDGKATLRKMPDTSMAKLSDSSFQLDEEYGEEIEITLRKLDSLIKQDSIPPPDIVKIDVEGAEAMVLRGASRTLSTARPVVLAEIHSDALFSEVTALLKEHDYVVERLGQSEPNKMGVVSHLIARPN